MKNLINKLMGAGGVFSAIDGSKTYLVGAIGILSGATGFLQEILKLVVDKDVLEVWAFVKALPHDRYILAMTMGLGAISLRHAIEKVLGAIGLRHAVEKAADPASDIKTVQK